MTRGPLLRALLWPASLLFGLVVRMRAWLYRKGVLHQRRLEGVVISVGNLSVGGTGKTPVVLWIAQRLVDEHKRVGILSRGYRGEVKTDAPATQILSDETWLLRQRLGPEFPLGVGADRFAQGSALQQQGIDWFVLDDGFQHLGLGRDVDIMLVDATDPFGGGRLLPAGRLREPKSALARADVVVITRSDHAPAIEAVVRRYTQAPIFYAKTFLEEVRPGTNSLIGAGPSEWIGKKFFAFCAIGNSSAFFEDVRSWGMQLVGQASFRDHHRYTARDLQRVERDALAVGAQALISTEKDSYNLGQLKFRKIPLYHCHVTMRVLEADRFWEVIHGTISRKRAGGAR